MTSISTPDGPMDLYVAGETDAVAAVIVVQEAFGVTSHIERCVERIAAEGYLALAPSLFHRTGSPVLAYDDFEKVAPHMQALSAEGITDDIGAVVAHLADRGFGADRRGIVGFCMGGTVAFVTATTGDVGAAVTFYGGGVVEGRFGFPGLVELAASLQCPWLGCYGDQDRGIPVEQVEQLREATTYASVYTEIVRYADAEHGFNCDDRASFNEEAAGDAWSRMLTFFGEELAIGE
jgi:carboxymethylenebutenolidase